MRPIVWAASAFLLFSCASFADSVRGSGRVQRETRVMGEFHGVAVGGGIRSVVSIGKQRVEVEADDNILPLVETIVKDGVLVGRFKPHNSLTSESAVIIHVTIPEATVLEASGGARIDAELSPTEELRAEASGGGEVHMRGVSVKRFDGEASGGGVLAAQGSADEVDLELSGGARLDGFKFQARKARVEGSGGGTARLAVSDSVRGDLSGGTSLVVRGNPHARVHTSGGSSFEVE
jgi:Putative auto-transporter adhesin, head GIN domain